MLGKLIKYELKATSRIFLPIYGAILLIAAANRVFIEVNIKQGITIMSLILGILCACVLVLNIIIIVQRFQKNLLGDEGYLMFTLPVKLKHLITSKLIAAVIWAIIGSIAALGTFFILVLTKENASRMAFELSHLMDSFFNELVWHQKIAVFEMLLIPFAVYITFVLNVYASLAIAQLPKFNKHRNIVSFISFFVLNGFFNWITYHMFKFINQTMVIAESEVFAIFSFTLLWVILIGGILYALTHYMIKHYLNLE